MAQTIEVSAIVPTRNRSAALRRMLFSLSEQSSQPSEIVVIDASTNDETEAACVASIPGLRSKLAYARADVTGAAVQRTEGLRLATANYILFLDDDVLFKEECIFRLWRVLRLDDGLGGVNAMIINQRYFSPGTPSRTLFRLLHGKAEKSYAGKCIGPALNLLPEDSPELPDVVPVEWLNTTCALYRREALPDPLFPKHFTGYSLMEDVALSLRVAKTWKLANARTARIYHHSQPAEYKYNCADVARMQLVNRHYVMTQILGRKGFKDYLKLALLESFGIASSLSSLNAWRNLPFTIVGKTRGIRSLLTNQRNERVSDTVVGETVN